MDKNRVAEAPGHPPATCPLRMGTRRPESDTSSSHPHPGTAIIFDLAESHLNIALTSRFSFQKQRSTPSLSLMYIRVPSCMQCEMNALSTPPQPYPPLDNEPPNGNQLTHSYSPTGSAPGRCECETLPYLPGSAASNT